MTGSSGDAVTALEARIIKQIEYYFSDDNLLKDKFLKKKIRDDDGWVSVDIMVKFPRFREITDNAQVICEALKKSPSGLMEVSEQENKIRRSPSKPLPGDTEERQQGIISRTVYAKPFPLDVKLVDLLPFFEEYGQVDRVHMVHLRKKRFKGTVRVTFANTEDAAKFVNEEETKFKEQALEVKCFRADYNLNATQRTSTAEEDTEGKPRKKKKPRKKRKPHKKGESETKEEEIEADLEVSQKMTKSAVLQLKGLNPEASRQQVKPFFPIVPQWHIEWVDFHKGAAERYIRLRKTDSAGFTLEEAKNADDGKVVIQGSETEVQAQRLKLDEEIRQWEKICQETAYVKRRCRRSRQGESNQTDGRRNSEGPHNQNEKEGGSDGEKRETEELPAKVIKSELVIKFEEDLKVKGALSDGEEQDTEEPLAKVTKSEMVFTAPQGKRKWRDRKQNKGKQNKKVAFSDGEEQDIEQPPVKITESDVVFKFEEVLKLKVLRVM